MPTHSHKTIFFDQGLACCLTSPALGRKVYKGRKPEHWDAGSPAPHIYFRLLLGKVWTDRPGAHLASAPRLAKAAVGLAGEKATSP